MSVTLSPARSIVVRKTSMSKLALDASSLVGAVGDRVSEDDDLLVLGPLFETDAAITKLKEIGLEYFEDFFDIPNTGGPVAEWCEIELRLGTTYR